MLAARSPEIFAPAEIPVTEGKKIENREMNVSVRYCGTKFSVNVDATMD